MFLKAESEEGAECGTPTEFVKTSLRGFYKRSAPTELIAWKKTTWGTVFYASRPSRGRTFVAKILNDILQLRRS